MTTQKPRPYAHKTKVPTERTRTEIERLLRKHHATGFALSWVADGRAQLVFELHGKRIRFNVIPPARDTFSTVAAWEAEERRRWRALLLLLKAKLELVASGDAALEQEFMAFLVLPGGATVGERLLPELDAALDGSPLPPLLGPP